MEKRHYRPHSKQRKEEADAKRKRPGYKARRWVVERTHSWLNRFRKLLVSFEKTEAGCVALLSFGGGHDLLASDYFYLRISSKCIILLAREIRTGVSA